MVWANRITRHFLVFPLEQFCNTQKTVHVRLSGFYDRPMRYIGYRTVINILLLQVGKLRVEITWLVNDGSGNWTRFSWFQTLSFLEWEKNVDSWQRVHRPKHSFFSPSNPAAEMAWWERGHIRALLPQNQTSLKRMYHCWWKCITAKEKPWLMLLKA